MKTLKYTIQSRDEVAKWCNGIVEEHKIGITFRSKTDHNYLTEGETLINIGDGYYEVFDIKKVDNVELDGIDLKDRPDFSDAYIVSADYYGKEMTEEQLEALSDMRDFVYDQIVKQI